MNTTRASALILAIAIFGDAATIYAQTGTAASPASATIVSTTTADANSVRLLAGRSTIVDVGMPIARVSLTSNDIADAMVTTPTQLLINGKVPGTISMFVWDRGGALRRFEVSVGRDLGQLNDQLRQLFPGERVEVQSTGRNIVISGNVTSKEVAEKVANVAAGYVEKKEEVVSLVQVNQAPQASQVLLRVRFAEVSRNAVTQLGLSLAANGAKDGRFFGRSTTQQYAAPEWDEDGKFVFSDFLNLFLFDTKNQVAGVLKALQNKGLFQSLAEPNLVAQSGKEASFLAGGEIPVPVVQGGGSLMSVSVMWKEFGVRLNFTPTVNGDRVHLKVRPEVSTLDFNNAVTLQGFRIPALSTRKTETELELVDGQTFAIAGLMNNQVSSTMQKIPGIGDIPVLGALFRSKAAQKDQTELVVMITPEILKTNSPGVTPNLPRTPEKFLDAVPEKKTHEMPPAAFKGGAAGRRADAEPAVAPAASPTPAPSRVKSAPTPSVAAATLGALTASPRTVTNAPLPPKAESAWSPATDVAAVDAAVAPSAPEPVFRPESADTPYDAERRSALMASAPAATAPAVKPEPAKDAQASKAEQKAAKKAAEQAAREQREQEKQAQKSARLAEEQAKAQARRDAEAARKQQQLEKKIAEAQKHNGGALASAR